VEADENELILRWGQILEYICANEFLFRMMIGMPVHGVEEENVTQKATSNPSRFLTRLNAPEIG